MPFCRLARFHRSWANSQAGARHSGAGPVGSVCHGSEQNVVHVSVTHGVEQTVPHMSVEALRKLRRSRACGRAGGRAHGPKLSVDGCECSRLISTGCEHAVVLLFFFIFSSSTMRREPQLPGQLRLWVDS